MFCSVSSTDGDSCAVSAAVVVVVVMLVFFAGADVDVVDGAADTDAMYECLCSRVFLFIYGSKVYGTTDNYSFSKLVTTLEVPKWIK